MNTTGIEKEQSVLSIDDLMAAKKMLDEMPNVPPMQVKINDRTGGQIVHDKLNNIFYVSSEIYNEFITNFKL